MGNSRKSPKRSNFGRSNPPPPPRSPMHNWDRVPPPTRDQRPRSDQPRSPDPKQVPTTPSAAVSGRHAAPRYGTPAPPQPPAQVYADAAKTPDASVARQKKAISKGWMIWAFLILSLLGGVGGFSAVSLFRIPNLPNCRAIFWPTAAAATRLQCADAYAEQGSVDNLLAAIDLVEALPSDHPMRAEINTRVEEWASQILAIADQTFHAGDLEEAIKTARKIPSNTAAADEVAERIGTWEDIWEQAESIFSEAEGYLKRSNFRDAFTSAIQLRSISNDYWSDERYDELVDLITQTREDVNTLANAERQANQGSVEAILEALAKVAAIADDSYVYEEAQSVVKTISRKLLDIAEAALERQDNAEALNIIGKIPEAAGLEEEIADFRAVATAYELTWAGTKAGYESAIVRLQSIGSDRPLYSRAQDLKRKWERELDAIAQLNIAKRLAQPGSVDSLREAIAEARKIARSNPRWEEAQDQIQQWREDVALVEDQPFLDRARLMASRGDRGSLEAAIVEARNIPSSSPLYSSAQNIVADWRWRIQRMDNEPILAQARRHAQSGQLADAILVADQIPPNQAFYDEAQTAIADWETERTDLRASNSYQEAVSLSQSGTVDSLAQAIAMAQGLPEGTTDWLEAQRRVDQWSWDLLAMAERAASLDATEAIAIAKQIPPRTEAYAQAQLRLKEWQVDLTTPSFETENTDLLPIESEEAIPSDPPLIDMGAPLN